MLGWDEEASVLHEGVFLQGLQGLGQVWTLPAIWPWEEARGQKSHMPQVVGTAGPWL